MLGTTAIFIIFVLILENQVQVLYTKCEELGINNDELIIIGFFIYFALILKNQALVL